VGLDAIVIGGGVVGLCTALKLGEYGYRVKVLEKECLGCGATGKAAGIVTKQLFLKHDIELVKESMEFIKKLSKDANTHLYEEVKSLLIVPESKLRYVKPILNQYRVTNVPYITLSDVELRRKFNVFKFSEDEIGVVIDGDLVIDPGSFVNALRVRLKELGIEVAEYVDAKLVSYRDEVAVSIGTEVLRADAVVVAAGVFTSQLLKGLGISLPQLLYRCQVLSLKMKGFPKIFVHDLTNHIYMVWETPETVLTGDGHYETISTFEEGLRISQTLFDEVIEGVMSRLSEDVDVELMNMWAYPCEVTPDGFPRLGKLSMFKNLYIAYGFDGYGLMRGPALAFKLAKLVAGKADKFVSKYRFMFDPDNVLNYGGKVEVREFHTPLSLLR